MDKKNPLNFIHYGGHRHEDDEEWSQYGSGLTAASMCCAGVWTLTTRYKTQEDTFKYVRCKFCWDDMARDNVFSPQSEEISEEEYNKIHHFHKGTIFQYDACRDSIFSTTFENVVDQLTKMISTKYYKALVPRQDGSNAVEYSTFDSFREEIETKAIEPEIPPTEREDHPHDILEYEIQVRRNDNGGEKIIYKKIQHPILHDGIKKKPNTRNLKQSQMMISCLLKRNLQQSLIHFVLREHVFQEQNGVPPDILKDL